MSIPLIAVVGSGRADAALSEHARDVGRVIARSGAGLVCGGMGGVMAAAAQGASEVLGEGTGRIVGVLPGSDRTGANRWLDLALPTGMGHARNVLVVLAADAVVAVGGDSGTLSEIAHAWHLHRPVASYLPAGGWGARVAGERIDGKRDDRVVPLADLDALRTWIAEALPGLGSAPAAPRSDEASPVD